MKQQDRDEMLVRIDQKVIAIEKVLFGKPTYSTVKEKVLTHGRVIWGTLFIALGAFIKSFMEK